MHCEQEAAGDSRAEVVVELDGLHEDIWVFSWVQTLAMGRHVAEVARLPGLDVGEDGLCIDLILILDLEAGGVSVHRGTGVLVEEAEPEGLPGCAQDVDQVLLSRSAAGDFHHGIKAHIGRLAVDYRISGVGKGLDVHISLLKPQFGHGIVCCIRAELIHVHPFGQSHTRHQAKKEQNRYW